MSGHFQENSLIRLIRMTAELQDLQVDPDGFVCVVAPDTYAGFVDVALTPESGHGLSGELDLRGL